MSTESQSPKRVSPDTSREPSAWRRFWAWAAAFDEALNTSPAEIQDRRILALEREVAGLKRRYAARTIEDSVQAERPQDGSKS